jgi:outer membrane protein OmpA-like peptidoglycan-associated protein
MLIAAKASAADGEALRSASFPVATIVGFPAPVDLPGSTVQSLVVSRTENRREVRFVLNADVLFDFDKSDLRPDANDYLTSFLEEHGAEILGRSITIEGHTDSIGTHAYNQRLSRERARTVSAWIKGHVRLKPSKVTELGFGELRPESPDVHPDGRDDPEGRQRNRRVEIIVRP